jgi:hypothetical protein
MAVPSAAWGQLPTTTDPAGPAPAASPQPAPEVGAGPSAAPTSPEPAPTTPSAEKTPPGDQYFVEPPGTPPPPPSQAVVEPPLPQGTLYEPPPPPRVEHLAPKTALWAGVRLGWFFPFGNVWAQARRVSASTASGYVLEGKPWRDYASSGPMLELDLGVRLSRSYTVFALWERAQLGSGDDESNGPQDGAESDFWALGLRASSNPNELAFLTEVAVGYRRARTFFENDYEYQFTDAPFEARLGLGAEYRLSRLVSFSSLLTIGVGGFGSAESVAPNGNAVPLTKALDEADGHAWATITVGSHFDFLPLGKN